MVTRPRTPILIQPASGHARAGGQHVNHVEGLARSHEQAIPLSPAKADVGAVLRKVNGADGIAVRRDDLDTRQSSAPQVAVDIAADAIRRRGIARAWIAIPRHLE